MTQTQHFTSAATWTPPAWVTKYRATVAGGQGFPYTDPLNQAGGLGAILSGILPASGPLTVGVGSRAGGNPGNGNGGKGGAASVVGSMVAGAGSGQGSDYYTTGQNPPTFKRAGSSAGMPGFSGGGGGSGDSAGPGFGGGADGSGGAGGSRPGGTNGTAGQSNAGGGIGGTGANRNSASGGGGGGGFGGGGGGSAGNAWASGQYGGFGGGGGSSTFGSATDTKFVGYNSGAPWADIEIAAAPLQPTLATPTGNVYIDRTQAQPLTFQANQASTDVLDAQTDAEVDYRLIGAGSWTTIAGLGTGTTATITAGTLAVGSYEWRARTKADGGVGDAMGVWGPYSETGYFRADNPAQAPTVTEPTSGAVVAVNSVTAEWTVTTQTSYQMRVVNDAVDNPGTIYADSGEQISAARTKTLTVGVNHVPAYVQLRVRDKTGGVWSAWVSVAVTIEWAGPPKPRVTLATDIRSIYVAVTNPAPVGVEPVADRIEVYVIEGDTRERRAILAPGDGWVYETPPSGVEVGIEAVAIYTPTNVQTSSGVTW